MKMLIACCKRRCWMCFFSSSKDMNEFFLFNKHIVFVLLPSQNLSAILGGFFFFFMFPFPLFCHGMESCWKQGFFSLWDFIFFISFNCYQIETFPQAKITMALRVVKLALFTPSIYRHWTHGGGGIASMKHNTFSAASASVSLSFLIGWEENPAFHAFIIISPQFFGQMNGRDRVTLFCHPTFIWMCEQG